MTPQDAISGGRTQAGITTMPPGTTQAELIQRGIVTMLPDAMRVEKRLTDGSSMPRAATQGEWILRDAGMTPQGVASDGKMPPAAGTIASAATWAERTDARNSSPSTFLSAQICRNTLSISRRSLFLSERGGFAECLK